MSLPRENVSDSFENPRSVKQCERMRSCKGSAKVAGDELRTELETLLSIVGSRLESFATLLDEILSGMLLGGSPIFVFGWGAKVAGDELKTELEAFPSEVGSRLESFDTFLDEIQ